MAWPSDEGHLSIMSIEGKVNFLITFSTAETFGRVLKIPFTTCLLPSAIEPRAELVVMLTHPLTFSPSRRRQSERKRVNE